MSEHLELVCFCEQRLTKFTSRILVTMKKNTSNSTEINPSRKLNLTNSISTNDSTKADKINLLNQFREKYFSTKNKKSN
jgi:hypothetical protein